MRKTLLFIQTPNVASYILKTFLGPYPTLFSFENQIRIKVCLDSRPSKVGIILYYGPRNTSDRQLRRLWHDNDIDFVIFILQSWPFKPKRNVKIPRVENPEILQKKKDLRLLVLQPQLIMELRVVKQGVHNPGRLISHRFDVKTLALSNPKIRVFQELYVRKKICA